MKMFLVGILCMLSTLAFGQDVPVDSAPAWITEFLMFIAAVPKIGPVIVEIAKWVGVIASVFTMLSVCVSAILKVPELAAKFAGAQKLAEQIAAINAKIQPYLKYLSIFNVKK